MQTLSSNMSTLAATLSTAAFLSTRQRDCSYFRLSNPGGTLTNGVYMLPGGGQVRTLCCLMVWVVLVAMLIYI